MKTSHQHIHTTANELEETLNAVLESELSGTFTLMLLNICSKTNKGEYQSEHETSAGLYHYHTLEVAALLLRMMTLTSCNGN